MGRHVLFLDLQEDADLIAAYDAHHAPGSVPEDILASIRASGIEEMEIHRSGNRLVMIIECSASFNAAAKADADRCNPAVLAWEAAMERYQKPLPWAEPGEKWIAGNPIFTLPGRFATL